MERAETSLEIDENGRAAVRSSPDAAGQTGRREVVDLTGSPSPPAAVYYIPSFEDLEAVNSLGHVRIRRPGHTTATSTALPPAFSSTTTTTTTDPQPGTFEEAAASIARGEAGPPPVPSIDRTNTHTNVYRMPGTNITRDARERAPQPFGTVNPGWLERGWVPWFRGSPGPPLLAPARDPSPGAPPLGASGARGGVASIPEGGGVLLLPSLTTISPAAPPPASGALGGVGGGGPSGPLTTPAAPTAVAGVHATLPAAGGRGGGPSEDRRRAFPERWDDGGIDDELLVPAAPAAPDGEREERERRRRAFPELWDDGGIDDGEGSGSRLHGGLDVQPSTMPTRIPGAMGDPGHDLYEDGDIYAFPLEPPFPDEFNPPDGRETIQPAPLFGAPTRPPFAPMGPPYIPFDIQPFAPPSRGTTSPSPTPTAAFSQPHRQTPPPPPPPTPRSSPNSLTTSTSRSSATSTSSTTSSSPTPPGTTQRPHSVPVNSKPSGSVKWRPLSASSWRVRTSTRWLWLLQRGGIPGLRCRGRGC